MKVSIPTLLFSFILFFSIPNFSQEKQISELENLKTDIKNKIGLLRDSIKRIDLKINAIKSKEIKQMISDSSIMATAKIGAKLKNSPSWAGEIITTFTENKTVVVMDFVDDYLEFALIQYVAI